MSLPLSKQGDDEEERWNQGTNILINRSVSQRKNKPTNQNICDEVMATIQNYHKRDQLSSNGMVMNSDSTSIKTQRQEQGRKMKLRKQYNKLIKDFSTS